MHKDILICGVGGQGTVLASRIIAAAAMEEGGCVHSAETIGMAQRGGPVTSHVRIGEAVSSPLIPHGTADLMLAFEPGEAVRNLHYLQAGQRVIANTRTIRPVSLSSAASESDGEKFLSCLREKTRAILVDAEEVCRPFGSTKVFNIVLLGIASGAGELPVQRQSILRQIEDIVPSRFVEMNRRAFDIGLEIGTGAGGE